VVGGEAVTDTRPLGPLVHSFFLDHLVTVRGLRPASVRSYRDTIRLLLCFVAADKKTKITKLTVEDLTFERVLGFLRYLEGDRHNHVRIRNQRLAALHTLFDYIATREPQMLGVCQQVAAIPMKRAAPAETHFLERGEIEALFQHLPRTGRLALRDHALLLFLYNTGARAQEVADLRAGHLELGEAAVVRLHGKGDKWRTCPLWRQTTDLLLELREASDEPPGPDAPVFCSATGEALTWAGTASGFAASPRATARSIRCHASSQLSRSNPAAAATSQAPSTSMASRSNMVVNRECGSAHGSRT
jgi:integrase/recombinase XerD